MENLKSITTELLIKELNDRGYNTSLLISKWDVSSVIQLENQERPDDEQIKLSEEDMINIVKNVDTENWQREINENITRTIQDDYTNKEYFTTKESNFVGNAVWATVLDNGERVETECIFDSDTNEVKEIEEFDSNPHPDDEDDCVNEFILYDGQMITSFTYGSGVWEKGQRIK